MSESVILRGVLLPRLAIGGIGKDKLLIVRAGNLTSRLNRRQWVNNVLSVRRKNFDGALVHTGSLSCSFLCLEVAPELVNTLFHALFMPSLMILWLFSLSISLFVALSQSNSSVRSFIF
jgi:hypothetical protein